MMNPLLLASNNSPMRKLSSRMAWLCLLALHFVAHAQTNPITGPGGLDKATQALSAIQTFLLGVAGTFITISLIGCGIGMAFYKKRWEDLAMPVMGGIVCGVASAVGAWLVS